MNPDRNVVGWFEIYVQDMARARAFYQNTFEVKLERLVNPELELWAFPGQPDNAGCSGALVRMEGKDSGTGGTTFTFPVMTVRSRQHARSRTAEKFTCPRPRSGNMASSH